MIGIFLLNLLELCEPSGTELLDVDRKRYAMNTRGRIPEMGLFVNQKRCLLAKVSLRLMERK